MNKPIRGLLAAALTLALCNTAAAIEVQLFNFDVGTGIGLDDPTPRAPVGGNPGKTLGEQRQIAYQYAADLWSAVLDGDVPVRVIASTQPLSCTPTSGTLAQAGSRFTIANFPGGLANTRYHIAIAKGILNQDFATDFDILTQFNGAIGVNPNCLTGSDWYYGLDGATPPGRINFLNVVMHEIAHGLGFSGFENVTSGALSGGIPSIYATYAFDNTQQKLVREMTNAERVASFVNDGNLVWTGANVTGQASLLLDNAVLFQATAPAAIAGNVYATVPAAFGPPAAPGNFTGAVVLADDGSANPTLACGPLANAGAIAGNIALVDRGVCPFVDKVRNAQSAGATGVLIGNNVAGLQAPGGDGPDVTIPVLGISLDTANAFKTNADGLTVALSVSDTQLQGADPAGRVQLYAPSARAPGSTYSHFDTRVAPNALMEPFNTASVQAHLNVDLTAALFEDEGWPLDKGTAFLGSCNTGVPVQEDGGLVIGANLIAQERVCRLGARNPGQYVACVTEHAERLRDGGVISQTAFRRINACAVQNR
jgi:hypothetical protein